MILHLKSEAGVALPVMTWMLVVVSLLVTGFFTVSLQLSDTTNEDRSSKRALAAAADLHRRDAVERDPVEAQLVLAGREPAEVRGVQERLHHRQLGSHRGQRPPWRRTTASTGWGAIGADKIRFNNSVEFQLTKAVKERPSGSQGAALRTAWGECRPTPTVATDPESGC